MKKIVTIILAPVIFILLIAYSVQNSSLNNEKQTFIADNISTPPVELPYTNEKTEQDFVLKIEADRPSYKEGEQINIVAYLTYTGEAETITIGHAMHPVGFNMYEHTHNIEIMGAMAQPYLVTTMKKNETLAYPLTGIGGYSEHDDQLVINFNKAAMAMKLLEGIYTVSAYASFDVGDSRIEEASRYSITTSIQIEVTK